MTATSAKPRRRQGLCDWSASSRRPRTRVQRVLDPDAFAKWIPPNGYTAHVYKFEPKVRGSTHELLVPDKKDTHFFGASSSDQALTSDCATRTSSKATSRGCRAR